MDIQLIYGVIYCAGLLNDAVSIEPWPSGFGSDLKNTHPGIFPYTVHRTAEMHYFPSFCENLELDLVG